jgi:hypothetical protein
MTLAHGTGRLESARLVLRRVAPDDLPFVTRIHALPEVAQVIASHARVAPLAKASVPTLNPSRSSASVPSRCSSEQGHRLQVWYFHERLANIDRKQPPCWL